MQTHISDSNIPDSVHTAATPMTAAANSTGTPVAAAAAAAPAPAPEHRYSIGTQQTHGSSSRRFKDKQLLHADGITALTQLLYAL